MLTPFVIGILIQAAQPLELVPFRTLQVIVPQGWKATDRGLDVRLDHETGASLIIRRSREGEDLDSFAALAVERIMSPLGFAKFEAPRHFRNQDHEWVQYEILGNRLSERRRILYRAGVREGGPYEIIYENSEDHFDTLLTETQAIASSLQLVSDANEQSAVANIRTINVAEMKFFSANRRWALLEELISSRLLDTRFGRPFAGYRFSVQLIRDNYRVEATPDTRNATGRYAYQSTREGVIRYSDRASLAPRGMAGRPVH